MNQEHLTPEDAAPAGTAVSPIGKFESAVTHLTVRQCILFLITLCALLYLPKADSLPLTDPDEARCGVIVQNMLHGGHWITPYLKDAPYFDKPAPFFWLAAAGQVLTGSVEFGGRLIAILAAVAAVLATFSITRRIAAGQNLPAGGENLAGLLAGAMLASSPFFFYLARFYRMDMPLAAFSWLALWWFWRYEGQAKSSNTELRGATAANPDVLRDSQPCFPQSDGGTAANDAAVAPIESCFAERLSAGRRMARWAGFYAFCGLATLMKGPAGLVLPGMIVAGYLLLTRRWTAVFEMFSPVGIAVYLAISVPWFVAVAMENPGYLNEFFLQQNFARFAGKTYGGHDQPAILFILLVFAGLAPWTVFLPGAMARTLPRHWRLQGMQLPGWGRAALLAAAAVVTAGACIGLVRLIPGFRIGVVAFLAMLLLAGGLVFLRRWTLQTPDQGSLFLFLAALVPLTFYCLSKTILPGYFLPVLAPLTAIAAIPLAKWIFSSQADRLYDRLGRRSLIVAVAACAALLLGGEIAFLWVTPYSAIPLAVAALAAVAMIYLTRKNSRIALLAVALVALVGVLYYAVFAAAPRMYEAQSAIGLVRAAQATPEGIGPDTTVCCWPTRKFSFDLYSKHFDGLRYRDMDDKQKEAQNPSDQATHTFDDLVALWNDPKSKVYCLVQTSDRVERLRARCPSNVTVIAKQRDFFLIRNFPATPARNPSTMPAISPTPATSRAEANAKAAPLDFRDCLISPYTWDRILKIRERNLKEHGSKATTINWEEEMLKELAQTQ